MALADDMYRFRNELQGQGIIFCYSGYMTEQVLTGIGDAIKRKLELEQADSGTARTVFGVFAEQMQNVIRYSAEREPQETGDGGHLRYGVLTVGRNDDRYFISCGNVIEKEDVERLRTSLTHIKSLDKEGLKALYKETLRGDPPDGSKGAGVGFIDIARRANNGFEFDFATLDDERSYFCIKAYV